MAANTLTTAQANIELAILNAESEAMSSSDFYAWLKELGLPDEAAIRLKGVAEMTTKVGKRVINVGKMILMKIIEFVKAHPKMVIGMAIGAAIGTLVNTVPLIGPLLAPIATLIGVAGGALIGYRGDKEDRGQLQNSGAVAIWQDAIEIAKEFFTLLIDIFNLTLSGATIQGT